MSNKKESCIEALYNELDKCSSKKDINDLVVQMRYFKDKVSLMFEHQIREAYYQGTKHSMFDYPIESARKYFNNTFGCKK